jgi:YVTN family beta-propeller protein
LRLRLILAATAAALAASHAAAETPSYHVANRIALPDGGWDLVGADPVLRRVYVARNDAVTAIDLTDNKVTGKLAPANRGHAVVPLRDGTEILVTDGGSNTAEIFDAKTGAPLASIKTGDKPDAATFDPATGLAVVMNGHDGSLTLIDPAARKAVGTIPVGGGLELGAGDGKGRLFVNVEDRNSLAVVDLKARKVLKTVPLAGCEGPTGVAYLPVSHRVVSSCANGVATVTDPTAGKVVAKLPIGQGPDSVIYDAKRKIAFVPAGRSGELDLFADEAKGVRPLGKVPTQLGARTGAVDETTGRLYLPAADYSPPATPGGRPVVKPGSVVAVVVEP